MCVDGEVAGELTDIIIGQGKPYPGEIHNTGDKVYAFMIKLNIQEADWIKEQTVPYGTSTRNVVMGNIIPAQFDSYCKIFYPFTIFHDVPATLVPNEQLKKPSHWYFDPQTRKLMADGKEWVPDELVQRRDKGEGSATRWKEMGERYGVTFNNQTEIEAYSNKFKEIGWPENLLFPAEGRLPMPMLSVVLDILTRYSGGKDSVRLYLIAPNSMGWKDYPKEVVEGRLDEIPDYFDRRYFIGWLFPPDRSWILHTDTDLHYTVLGGPAPLIDMLVKSPLEVLKCDASTVIYHKE